MPKSLLPLLTLTALCAPTPNTVFAQPAFIREAIEGNNRLPNDNVEGTIWEYKGELEKGELEGKKDARIGGMFRMEDGGVFGVGESIRLPGVKDIEKLLAELRSGSSKLLKLPSFKPKRIGDYKASRTGRLTLEFDDESDDPNALFGTLILRKDKDKRDVYFGDFREKEGKKTVRTWQMTVRKVQD